MRLQFADRQPYRLHAVAFAHGDAAVLFGIKVDRDAEWRADSVLTAVTLADTAGFVVFAYKAVGQLSIDFLRRSGKLLRQRQDAGLDRSQRRMQVRRDGVSFIENILVVSVA